MKKKKIVSLFESIKIWWWVEKVQADLSIWLVEAWYDFTHLVLQESNHQNIHKWNIYSFREEFIFWFWFQKIISLFRLWYKVSKYCNKEKVDVILWQGDFFYMIVSISKILFWIREKCVWVVHTTISVWPKFIMNILIFLLKRLDGVVLISKEEYKTFVETYWFEEKKLELIYNSVNVEKIKALKNEKVTDFDFDSKIFTFINIWRLTYQKWQDILIKAFDTFNKKYPKSQLLILWEGELIDTYEKLISDLENKNIHLLWKKDNVYKYLQISDCFVLSSRFEGFWLVLVEAMATGLPIISTKCPSWPSEILWSKNSDSYENQGRVILTQNENEVLLLQALTEMYKSANKKSDYDLDAFSSKNNIQKWEIFIKNL